MIVQIVFCTLIVIVLLCPLAANTPISWSPQGDRLVYSLPEEQELTVVDVHTRQSLSLGRGSGPNWSPASNRILFVVVDSWPEPPGPVFVINADGTDRRLIAETGGSPHWSPDGRRLAFSFIRQARCYDTGYQPEFVVVIQDEDGGNRQEHSLLCEGVSGISAWWSIGINFRHFWGNIEFHEYNSEVFDPETGNRGWVPYTASWSGASGKLAFFADEDFAKEFPGPTPLLENGTYVVDGSGSFEQMENRIRQGDVFKVTDLTGLFRPAWSPDGRYLAINHWIEEDDARKISIVGADGSGLTRLTARPGWDSQPSWSPTGNKIAYYSDSCTGSVEWIDVDPLIASGVESTGWGTLKNQPR